MTVPSAPILPIVGCRYLLSSIHRFTVQWNKATTHKEDHSMLTHTRRAVHRVSKKSGMAPGSLVHIGETYLETPILDVHRYTRETAEHTVLAGTDEIPAILERDANDIVWINITGLSDAKTIREIGRHLHIHPLSLEDIMNTSQRPKVEQYPDQLLVILKMVDVGKDDMPTYEQISLIIGDGYALSFQERPGDVFDPIRTRILQGTGIIRKMNSDYLAYALIDSVIDRYYAVLEQLYEKIEAIEERIDTDYSQNLFVQINALRKEIIFLRKSIWPMREATSSILRDDVRHLDESVIPYYRDIYDHVIQVMDQIETCREIISAVSDSYMSSLSNNMNGVMKILTLISTIFIPLSFVAGLYGMNFVNMPELQLAWGYFAVLGVMAAIGTGMLIFFKRKGWF
jgi:magnesium transporter